MIEGKNTQANELKQIIRAKNSQELLEAKFESSKGMQDLYREAYQLWNELPEGTEVFDYDRERILDRVHHQIKLEEKVFIRKITDSERFLQIFSRVAAVLIIPLLLVSILMYDSISKNTATPGYSEIYVPAGTRTSFVLPDGTKGWLNSGSCLRFPNRFAGKTRTVELSGEGFFKVEKGNSRPFIVKTNDINIKVHGTSFNVFAYPDGIITEVVLEEGKVEVLREEGKKTNSLCVLKPNEGFILDKKTGSKRLVQVDASGITAWKEGKMVFRYETFKNVIEKLNRWYNADLVIKDAILESYVYYGTFQDETLDEVLKLIKMTAPISYRDYGRIQNPDGTFGKRKVELYYRKP